MKVLRQKLFMSYTSFDKPIKGATKRLFDKIAQKAKLSGKYNASIIKEARINKKLEDKNWFEKALYYLQEGRPTDPEIYRVPLEELKKKNVLVPAYQRVFSDRKYSPYGEKGDKIADIVSLTATTGAAGFAFNVNKRLFNIKKDATSNVLNKKIDEINKEADKEFQEKLEKSLTRKAKSKNFFKNYIKNKYNINIESPDIKKLNKLKKEDKLIEDYLKRLDIEKQSRILSQEINAVARGSIKTATRQEVKTILNRLFDKQDYLEDQAAKLNSKEHLNSLNNLKTDAVKDLYAKKEADKLKYISDNATKKINKYGEELLGKDAIKKMRKEASKEAIKKVAPVFAVLGAHDLARFGIKKYRKYKAEGKIF